MTLRNCPCHLKDTFKFVDEEVSIEILSLQLKQFQVFVPHHKLGFSEQEHPLFKHCPRGEKNALSGIALILSGSLAQIFNRTLPQK